LKTLVWFRNDLRIADNTALAAAMAQGGGAASLSGVLLIAMEQWKQHDWGLPKIDFILRNALALSQSLAAMNIPLHVIVVDRFADAPNALLKITGDERCLHLFFNKEYEVNEVSRDEAVTSELRAAGVKVSAFHDQTVLPPDQLRTGAGQFYRVFTPFKNSWISAIKERLPLSTVRTIKAAAASPRESEHPSDDLLRHAIAKVNCPATITAMWPAGESEAKERLKRFTQQAIRTYKTARDFPALQGTSALSPYLSAGVISARKCLTAAISANDGQLGSGDHNITTWISELVWREFYRHVMVGFPRICKHQPFRSETRRIQWRESEADFQAWCQGETGVPIVDAAMKQLLATGWMHNRLRMITAMYLTKDLFIDWRKGERFFMQHLVDADLAQNNGGWQWSSSTGTDAAPYFRIFNPISQSKRFDPQGEFIRQYCPHLAGLDDKMIHDPSQLPPLMRGQLDYPSPIADHSKARARVMEAFKAIK